MKIQAAPPVADSLVKDETSNLIDKSAFDDMSKNSTFLSLTAIEAFVQDASLTSSESFLAKEIISKFGIDKPKRKKDGRKKGGKCFLFGCGVNSDRRDIA